jgi:hypothetical protein
LAKRFILSFKTNDYDYFKLIANGLIIIYFIIKIIKLGKEQNNQDSSSL